MEWLRRAVARLPEVPSWRGKRTVLTGWTKISSIVDMSRTTVKKNILTMLLVLLAGGAVVAQQIAPVESSELVVPYDEASAPGAPDIIFSNLDPLADNRFNSDPFFAFGVSGKSASGETEVWDAIRFIPKVGAQAKVLMAAIGYISGTKLVNLGIYSDNGNGTVGTVLPGGQGSTTEMPDVGDCCQLAKVTLAGDGVSLTAGTTYWLVATSDDVNGPTFSGAWRVSNRAAYASFSPPFPWDPQAGQWPAAQIRGTRVQALGLDKPAHIEVSSPEVRVPAANITTIFTNLGPSSTDRYDSFNGIPVAGNNVPFEPELWQAVRFTARTDSQAKTLAAAIGYISGTRKVNLGIYGDIGGTVGTLLPGGQGSTTEIPDSGVCCELAKVKLPGAGVALIAGTQYWLVASPDNVNAPDFKGLWQFSNLAVSAYREPENFINWTSFSGVWLAAEIRGTSP